MPDLLIATYKNGLPPLSILPSLPTLLVALHARKQCEYLHQSPSVPCTTISTRMKMQKLSFWSTDKILYLGSNIPSRPFSPIITLLYICVHGWEWRGLPAVRVKVVHRPEKTRGKQGWQKLPSRHPMLSPSATSLSWYVRAVYSWNSCNTELPTSSSP